MNLICIQNGGIRDGMVLAGSAAHRLAARRGTWSQLLNDRSMEGRIHKSQISVLLAEWLPSEPEHGVLLLYP
jgi:hypothetical protein